MSGGGAGGTNSSLTGRTNFGVLYGVTITISKANYADNTANNTNTAPAQIFTGTISRDGGRGVTVDVPTETGRTNAYITANNSTLEPAGQSGLGTFIKTDTTTRSEMLINGGGNNDRYIQVNIDWST
jgi:hypothetical protein